MQLKQVIVFRTKFPNGKEMNKGKMIAQGAHAAMMCLIHDRDLPTDQYVNVWDWAWGSMAKIAVAVDTLEELNELEKKAKEAGLLCYEVIDSGKTVFNGVPTKTCIAIGPAESSEIDKITGGLKLL